MRRVILLIVLLIAVSCGKDKPSAPPFTPDPADTERPYLAITYPTQGQQITGRNVRVQATATDNKAIYYVLFKQDNTANGCFVYAPGPYYCDFVNLARGSHMAVAYAYDRAGNEAFYRVDFSVTGK